MKVNLHTHTYRCRHAKGTDEEYVLAAIDAGYDKLGFADHTPFPYKDDYINGDKMLVEELPDYIDSVLSLKEKYKGQIEILLGLECEAVPEFFPFLREMKRKMDYLILGSHGDKRIDPYSGALKEPQQLWRYLDFTVEGMETGLFLYLAHPDVMLGRYPVFDDTAAEVSRKLCREAKRLNMPLEYNLYGIYKGVKPGCLGYPYDGFWRIAAEENCTAVVGVDAHNPGCFEATPMEPAVEYLRSLGITVLEDPTNP
jgi:histidinol-phosphatase (PHP family)